MNYVNKEKQKAKRREDMAGEVLSIEDIVSHKLTEDDFYRGVPTILNSEVAALVMAEKLYKEVDEYSHIE